MSETQSDLRLKLQTFGIAYDHITSTKSKNELSKLLYNDIVNTLPYDPFFPSRSPSFERPLRTQQGTEVDTEYSPSARGRPCGHVFRKGETLYRCRNCGIDDTCVLCAKCFKATDHEGHDVAMSLNGGSGGCCDCGDIEAWRVDMKCSYHYSAETIEMPEQSQVPENIEENIRRTVSQLLDFILDILSHAKNAGKAPSLEDDTTNPEVDAKMAALTGSAYREEHEASMAKTWSTVLWNDEKHDFEEVIDIVKRSCKSTRAFGKAIAASVDSRGRATVYTGTLSEAVRIAQMLGRIRLGVTVRSARDIFREDMVETAVLFLQDLANLTIFTTEDGAANTEMARRIICEELCKPWTRGSSKATSNAMDSSIPMLDSDDYAEGDESELEMTIRIGMLYFNAKRLTIQQEQVTMRN